MNGWVRTGRVPQTVTGLHWCKLRVWRREWSWGKGGSTNHIRSSQGSWGSPAWKKNGGLERVF